MLARSRRPILLAIFAAVVLPLGGAAVVTSRADASWQAMAKQVEALRTQIAARDHHRPPLWGEAGTGTAFSHYDRAVAAARAAMATQNTQHLLASSDAELAADQVRRASWREALDELQAGSHAADTAPPPWKPGQIEGAIVNLLQCRDLANIAMFEARACCHERNYSAAVRHSLDAAQFGADLMHRGLLINQMIGSAITAIATEWPEVTLDALDRPALDLLAAGLERLDCRLPVMLDQDTELLWLADNFQQVPTNHDFVPSVMSWRHGFSLRWTMADAFLFAAELAHQLGEAQQLDWPQRRAMLELECSAATESPNPMVPMIVPSLIPAESSLRGTVAQVRMLRMAIDLHRGLDVPPLRDPLGSGPIVVDRSDEGVILRCEGTEHGRPLQRTVPR